MRTHPIPTYASDGRRIRAYSLEAVERLLSLSLIVVRRNRKGAIVAAHFRPRDGANPMRATASMGQRYVYLDGRTWTHKSLIQRQDIEELTGVPLDSREDVDLYLRGIFRAVPLSVMRKDPAKIVDIAEYRKRKSVTPAQAKDRKAA